MATRETLIRQRWAEVRDMAFTAFRPDRNHYSVLITLEPTIADESDTCSSYLPPLEEITFLRAFMRNAQGQTVCIVSCDNLILYQETLETSK
jgi:hypothetical protein